MLVGVIKTIIVSICVCIQVVLAIHVRPGQADYDADCTVNSNCTATVEECVDSKCACASQHYYTGTACAAGNICRR